MNKTGKTMRTSWLALAAVLATIHASAQAADPASWLGLPVTYAADGYTFHPWPAKAIKEVKVHTSDPITIRKAWITPDWGAWITGGKTNRIHLEADEIVARPSSLARLGIADGKTTHKVTAVSFAHLKLLVGATSIALPAGEMEFAEDGTLKRIAIAMEDGVKLDASPHDGKLSVLMNTGNWKWAALPGLRFDQVVAQGELSDDALVLDKIGATGLGGSVDGVVRLNFTDAFAMESELGLDKLASPEFLKGFYPGHTVQGTLNAKIKLASSGATLKDLGQTVAGSGSFTIKSGSIDRLGLIEAVRRPTPGFAGGGLTRFQTLEGSFSGTTGKPASITIRRLDGGALQGSGSFQVGTDGSVRGSMAGSIKLPNGDTQSRSMALGGSVKAPELTVR